MSSMPSWRLGPGGIEIELTDRLHMEKQHWFFWFNVPHAEVANVNSAPSTVNLRELLSDDRERTRETQISNTVFS